MIKHNDPRVIKNTELYEKKKEWGWANNMSREDILEFWPWILNWDINKLNEILKERGFEAVETK